MILHTVNKSPFTTTLLQECLAILGQGHSLLLIEDGVYGALATTPLAGALQAHCERHQRRLFALREDLEARGLNEELLLPQIQAVGYPEFVQLAAEHKSVQSWF